MTLSHLSVTRTARYFTLGPETRGIRELWIVLHGHSQLAVRFLQAFEPLNDGATRIVAPEALSRFYLGDEAGRASRNRDRCDLVDAGGP